MIFNRNAIEINEPRALYVRGERVKLIRGGADHVSSSLLCMLRTYFPHSIDELYLDEFCERTKSRRSVLFDALQGWFFPYGRKEAIQFRRILQGYDFVFLDQSVYGRLLSDAKACRPDLKTAVFFHNVECEFYAQRIWHAGKIHNALLLPSILKAERESARADLVMALTGKDSKKLRRIYGRSADCIIMPVVADRYNRTVADQAQSRKKPYTFTMLFAGSAFPPNIEGIRWFVRKVLPQVQGELFIVGRGFEKYRARLAAERVHVIGAVEEIDLWYYQSDCVVSPIFWGSGIKVKTAESFMLGKTVVGTKESFVGYDPIAANAIVADEEEQFVKALRRLHLQTLSGSPKENAQARAYYLRELSLDAQYAKFSAALDKLFANKNSSSVDKRHQHKHMRKSDLMRISRHKRRLSQPPGSLM